MGHRQQDENDKNFFDDLNSGFDPAKASKIQKDSESKAARLDYLIHQTFEQNEAGKELLAIWKEALIMSATAESGMDKVVIGINEGQKRFIRGIILTINRVEKGDR